MWQNVASAELTSATGAARYTPVREWTGPDFSTPTKRQLAPWLGLTVSAFSCPLRDNYRPAVLIYITNPQQDNPPHNLPLLGREGGTTVQAGGGHNIRTTKVLNLPKARLTALQQGHRKQARPGSRLFSGAAKISLEISQVRSQLLPLSSLLSGAAKITQSLEIRQVSLVIAPVVGPSTEVTAKISKGPSRLNTGEGEKARDHPELKWWRNKQFLCQTPPGIADVASPEYQPDFYLQTLENQPRNPPVNWDQPDYCYLLLTSTQTRTMLAERAIRRRLYYRENSGRGSSPAVQMSRFLPESVAPLTISGHVPTNFPAAPEPKPSPFTPERTFPEVTLSDFRRRTLARDWSRDKGKSKQPFLRLRFKAPGRNVYNISHAGTRERLYKLQISVTAWEPTHNKQVSLCKTHLYFSQTTRLLSIKLTETSQTTNELNIPDGNKVGPSGGLQGGGRRRAEARAWRGFGGNRRARDGSDGPKVCLKPSPASYPPVPSLGPPHPG
ncbi:hypothetical protein Bbelb_119840 [Branchiostoma belcheri]|nr:hypothetical protein Bbelb_119840 [Branchiostoma belcheri]